MFKEHKIKTPNNSIIRNLSTNFSFDMSKDNSIDNKKIYKLHDRLLNRNLISLLSKKNNNISKTDKNRKKELNSRNKIFEKIKNFRFKSAHKKFYLNFSSKKNKKKRIFSTIDENKDENKPRISFILHREKELLKRRDSMVFLNLSPDILSERGPKNRKNMLINQIIKFNIKRKTDEKKMMSPTKPRKSYYEFIEKKNKIKYNPNFNSPFIHKINSNYYLDNIGYDFSEGFNSPKFLKLKNRKTIDKSERKELELESKDKVEEMSVDLQKYKKAIKIFLTDETKLNQINIQEEFLDSYTNKINYLFDDRKFPTIKNNLKKLVLIFHSVTGCEWNRLNMVEKSTLTYLHKLKVKIQRELDEIKEENKEKQFKINQQIGKYNIQKKRKKRMSINKSHIESEKNEGENIDDDNKENNEEKEEEESIINQEDLYDFEEFFVHKGNSNRIIKFATDKLAYTVYNNPKFYKSPLKINRNKSNKGKTTRRKKIEFDLYI